MRNGLRRMQTSTTQVQSITIKEQEMGYFAQVDQDIQDIDAKLDEIEELIAGLPIRPGQKRVIVQKIYDLYEEIESAVEVSAVDFE